MFRTPPRSALTGRGRRAVYASLALATLALVFGDAFMLSAPLILISLLFYEFKAVRSAIGRIQSLVKLEPDRVEAVTIAGKPFICNIRAELSAGLPLGFESPLEGAHFQLDSRSLECLEAGRGAAELKLEFLPKLAGQYGLEVLIVRVRGRFGLVEGVGEVAFKLALKVYPRVIAPAVAAAKFLLAAGGLGIGEQPIPLKGGGLDYAGSRDYVPGDALRHMDWKATARLGRLIVKEFYVEGGAGLHLVYEAVAPNPASLDELSATFLSLALAVAEQGLQLGLTVHDGEKVLLHIPRAQPALAVALALQYALRAVEVPLEWLYDLLEPRAASELKGMLEGLSRAPLLEAELSALEGAITEPYRVLERTMSVDGERAQLILVSSLSRDPLPVLELACAARRRGRPLIVLQPTRPWIWADGLEEAYRLYECYVRLCRALERRGIRVVASIEELLKHVPTAEAVMRD